jgi:hypothetical protein
MPVIAHQAIAAHPHIESLHAFRENPLEPEEIAVLAEYAQPTVGPIEHVVHISAQSDPLRPWHSAYSIGHDAVVKPEPRRKKYRTPLILLQQDDKFWRGGRPKLMPQLLTSDAMHAYRTKHAVQEAGLRGRMGDPNLKNT